MDSLTITEDQSDETFNTQEDTESNEIKALRPKYRMKSHNKTRTDTIWKKALRDFRKIYKTQF